MRILSLLLLVTAESAHAEDAKFLERVNQIRMIVGENCVYNTDTAIRETQTNNCGLNPQKVCHVVASCSIAKAVQGSCFVDQLCPVDPVHCLAKRDLVVVRRGADAVEKRVRPSGLFFDGSSG